MIDTLLDAADPIIAEILYGVIVTFFGLTFRKRLKTKESQESLHKALNTGVDLITDMLVDALRSNDKVSRAEEQLDMVVAYTKQSVPDAVKYLKASEDQLQLMASAKIKARFAELGAKQ